MHHVWEGKVSKLGTKGICFSSSFLLDGVVGSLLVADGGGQRYGDVEGLVDEGGSQDGGSYLDDAFLHAEASFPDGQWGVRWGSR